MTSPATPPAAVPDVIAEVDCRRLANFIVSFLRNRNGGELSEAFAGMTVESYELLHDELEEIIRHRGKPPTGELRRCGPCLKAERKDWERG